MVQFEFGAGDPRLWKITARNARNTEPVALRLQRAAGIDRPLDIIRMGHNPPVGYGFEAWGGPYPIMPFGDWRGTLVGGTTAQGVKLPCPDGKCLVYWPGSRYRAFLERDRPVYQRNWFGSLTAGQENPNGLMYMRNRYYNPITGAFTQTDPIGLAGGLNSYGYAEGNPVSYSDPYGLCVIQLRTNAISGAAGKMGKNHAYIVTIAPDNTRTHFRGGPSRGGLGSSGSSQTAGGASSEGSGSRTDSGNGTSPGAGAHKGSRGPMGAVRADREPGNGAETDRPSAENPLTSSTTVLSNDESCEKYQRRMGAEMLRINYTEAPYNPLGRNSNSVARTLLRSIGIENVRPPVSVPGWDSDLYHSGW